MTTYDSRTDTLQHSLRVGELLVQLVTRVLDRAVSHDRSKTESPEVEVFDEFTPKLQLNPYGSPAYAQNLEAMGDGLRHHYEVNRHHPEHFTDGVNGMNLVDVVEMLADWKAATDRTPSGDLPRSLNIQRDRFGLSDQLFRILWNTAQTLGWMDAVCGKPGTAPNGEALICTVLLDRPDGHDGPHADGLNDNLEWAAWAA